MKRTLRRGITFIELLIAIFILSILAIVVYMLLASTGAHAATNTTMADLESQCRVIMDDVTRDLRNTPNTRCTLGGTNMTAIGGWWVSDTVTLDPVSTESTDASPATVVNPFTGAIATRERVVWAVGLLESGVADGLNTFSGTGSNDGLADETEIVRTQTVINAGVRRYTRRGTSRFPTTALAVASGGSTAPLFARAVPVRLTTGEWQLTSSPPALTFAIPSTTQTVDATQPHVTVTLTLQGLDASGQIITRSMTTTVVLKN